MPPVQLILLRWSCSSPSPSPIPRSRLQLLYDRLASRFGFEPARVRLSRRKLTGGEIVYGPPHRITISAHLSPAEQEDTLRHEAAHAWAWRIEGPRAGARAALPPARPARSAPATAQAPETAALREFRETRARVAYRCEGCGRIFRRFRPFRGARECLACHRAGRPARLRRLEPPVMTSERRGHPARRGGGAALVDRRHRDQVALRAAARHRLLPVGDGRRGALRDLPAARLALDPRLPDRPRQLRRVPDDLRSRDEVDVGGQRDLHPVLRRRLGPPRLAAASCASRSAAATPLAVAVAFSGMLLFFVGTFETRGLRGRDHGARLEPLLRDARPRPAPRARPRGARPSSRWGNVLAAAGAPAVRLRATSPCRRARPRSSRSSASSRSAAPTRSSSRGLRHVTATEASLIGMLEPIANPIWVFLFVGERPTALSIAGGAIVLWRRSRGAR